MKLGEFFVELGVLSDAKSVKEFSGAIGEMSLQTVAGIAALAGLEFSLVKIAAEAMNAAVGFEMFRSETGLSWEQLQKWQIAGAQVNVTAESIASSVTQLSRNLAEIRLGHGNRAPFQMLGVDTSGDAFAVLARIRERIRALNLDRPTASNMLSQMGISPDMIRLIELTDYQFRKLSTTVHGMTGQQEQTFYRSRQAIIEWGLALKQYGIDGVSHLLDAFGLIVGYLERIPNNFQLMVGSVVLLTAAFFPLTAAIAAFVLVLEDLSGYATGKDSAIGRIVKGVKDIAADFPADDPRPIDDFLDYVTGKKSAYVSPGQQRENIKTITQHISVAIHGNDPHENARQVKRVLDRSHGGAENQLDNQGF